MFKTFLSLPVLALLAACGLAEGSMDADGRGELIIIDHSAYPYGSLYWE